MNAVRCVVTIADRKWEGVGVRMPVQWQWDLCIYVHSHAAMEYVHTYTCTYIRNVCIQFAVVALCESLGSPKHFRDLFSA